IAVLASAFSLPKLLLADSPPEWTAYVPPVWFLDLHQFVIGRGAPFSGSAVFPIEATFAVFTFAMAIYALTYYRQFTRIPEQTAILSRNRPDGSSLVREITEGVFVRAPFPRARY